MEEYMEEYMDEHMSEEGFVQKAFILGPMKSICREICIIPKFARRFMCRMCRIGQLILITKMTPTLDQMAAEENIPLSKFIERSENCLNKNCEGCPYKDECEEELEEE